MRATATTCKHKPFNEGVSLPYQAAFDNEQLARLKMGLVPRQMEDKWFIYYEEPHLFLHRSWTGQPVYRLTLKGVPNGAEVAEALWSKDVADSSVADAFWSKDVADSSELGHEYEARLLDFLVSNLLLGQAKPFPVPPGLTEPMDGVFQHHISGTGYPQSPTKPKLRPWWRRIW
jgi:hypothetical protein